MVIVISKFAFYGQGTIKTIVLFACFMNMFIKVIKKLSLYFYSF